MAVSSRHSGFRKNGTSLELYVEGTLVCTFTTTGMTLASGVTAATLPAALTIGGIAYTFPGDNGDAGEQLQTDGSGVLTWEASGV